MGLSDSVAGGGGTSTSTWPQADYFGQQTFSDCDIIIQAGDQVLKTLPGHRLVLASESEVCQAKMMRWSNHQISHLETSGEVRLLTPQQQQQQVGGATAPQGDQQQTPQQQQQQAAPPGREALLLLLDHPQQLEAAEHLLQFFYRKSLPPGLSFQQLVSLLLLAHYHGAPRAQSACVAALVAAADQLDWQAWFSLLRLPAGLTDQEPSLAALFEEADGFMLGQLADLEVALNQPQLRAWFLALPEPYLLRLLARKDLAVAAESSVVSAITLWLQAQAEGQGQGGQPASRELHKHLAQQLRMVAMPASFMTNMLPHLKWFKKAVPTGVLLQCCGLLLLLHEGLVSLAPFKTPNPAVDRQHGCARLLGRLSPLLHSSYPLLPPSWLAPARKASKHTQLQLEVELSQQQLQARWDKVSKWHLSSPVFWAGYLWQLCWRITPRTNTWTTTTSSSSSQRAPLQARGTKRSLSLTEVLAVRSSCRAAAAAEATPSTLRTTGSPGTPWGTSSSSSRPPAAAPAAAGGGQPGEVDRWQVEVGVMYTVPGVKDQHCLVLLEQVALRAEGAHLAPGLRRPVQPRSRHFPDPTLGITSLKAGDVLPCLEVLPCWRNRCGNVCWGDAAAAEQVAHNRLERRQWQQTQDELEALMWQDVSVEEGPAGQEAERLHLKVVIEKPS